MAFSWYSNAIEKEEEEEKVHGYVEGREAGYLQY